MNEKKLFLIVLLLFGGLSLAQSQIKITTPENRFIYQQDNSGRSTLYISGVYTRAIDRVEARLVPVLPGQGFATAWLVVQTNPQNGIFQGSLRAQGGWYTLEVRGLRAGVIVSTDAVARVGVGEVIIVAGQSNAQGIVNYGAPSAADDRVNCVVYDNFSTGTTADPANITIAQLKSDVNIGPRGRSAWCWGALGDLLAEKLNVPILFMNVGYESTSVKNWAESAQGANVSNLFTSVPYPAGQPYANLRFALQYYGAIFGTRAILWMHGESDNIPLKTSRADYQNGLQLLINSQRRDTYQYIPWVIARSSLTLDNDGLSKTSANVIAGQNGVINAIFNNIYPGPLTDGIQVPRLDGVHFQNNGLSLLANAWNQTLNLQFFSSTIPAQALPAQPLTASCVANNSLALTAPTGFAAYRWSNGAASSNTIVNATGSYRATLRDAQGNVSLSTKIDLTEAVQPPVPTIVPSGSVQVCADSSVVITATTSANNTLTWNTSATTNSIRTTQAGSYFVRATNIFGCASGNSAPLTLSIRPRLSTPTVTQVGQYALQANITDKVSADIQSVRFDWKRGTNELMVNTSEIRVNQLGDYNVRSRIGFDLGGGVINTCVSPFSSFLRYTPPATDEGLLLYPNPNGSGKFSVETKEDLTNVLLSVYTILGQEVVSNSYSILKQRTAIDLSTLAGGYYIVKLRAAGFNASKRIFIEK